MNFQFPESRSQTSVSLPQPFINFGYHSHWRSRSQTSEVGDFLRRRDDGEGLKDLLKEIAALDYG
ncbi:hypothetical protein HanHA300_Chr08g0278971 [Helianthus annuus]|nr:hypothetical protein HanHA300_Chr08g0278971 [Helianthus annuus]KAJ0553417.1 hypothetical protein HanHA89_Chr08g0296151 [Helianthus annuus]KAJ0719078.1 hypothetical protein HanLR1_Chr08g0277731 [Helianthus annuus]KAJ0722333.1 hypothetical protein HanOQP8_Chr08g0285451 [Helianthus annuus]